MIDKDHMNVQMEKQRGPRAKKEKVKSIGKGFYRNDPI